MLNDNSLLVEGILTLCSEELRGLYDLKIFVVGQTIGLLFCIRKSITIFPVHRTQTRMLCSLEGFYETSKSVDEMLKGSSPNTSDSSNEVTILLCFPVPSTRTLLFQVKTTILQKSSWQHMCKERLTQDLWDSGASWVTTLRWRMALWQERNATWGERYRSHSSRWSSRRTSCRWAL